MESTNWLRQAPDRPLFPDLLWSRPENKAQAGKLLIVGGNLHGFTGPAAAFSAAEKAGIGVTRVLLPDKLQKTVSKLFPEAQFTPSTPSGSFARSSLADLLEATDWADGVLLAGDFGKNSETAVLLESFLDKFKGLVTIAGDGVDYLLNSVNSAIKRENTVVLANFSQLQALAKNNHPIPPLTHDMGLYELVIALAEWSKESTAALITEHQTSIVVAQAGKVSTTPVKSVNLTDLASYISVWWLQNPSKPFEALTTAVYHCQTS